MRKTLIAALGSLVAAGAALASCSGGFSRAGDGVPLAQLDQSGAAPTGLALTGPDRVAITPGDRLAITVDGSDSVKDALRFQLHDGTLTIGRVQGLFHTGISETATVHVVMPPVRALTMAGSGSIATNAVDGQRARITIAGTGFIDSPQVTTQELNVDIAGTGRYRAGGGATKLALKLAGTGTAIMNTLRVDSAAIQIAGSGRAAFSSDGTVVANILGSGEVHVFGRAHCTANTVGSGRLVCQPIPAS